MRWFKKIVWRLTKDAWENNEEFEKEEHARRIVRAANKIGTLASYAREEVVCDNNESPRARSMSFKLYKCVGGHILETNVYNRREDEHEHTLYMIKEEDDFAQQVAQSIMLEMMKQ
jgi:hypothetical protein